LCPMSSHAGGPKGPLHSWVGAGLQRDEMNPGRAESEVKATVIASGFSSPEGPCFDRRGNLFVVDWAAGIVHCITLQGQVTSFVDTGGMPAGACFGPRGHLYVCDSGRKEVLDIAPDGTIRVAASGHGDKPFLGPNDCACDAKGNLYFSDADGLHPLKAFGCVYLMRPDGRVELFAEGFMFPNGLAVSADGAYLYLAETFARRIHRFTLDRRGRATGQEAFAELDGGVGPDGLALDEQGNLYVAHFGKGVVAVFNPTGRKLAELCTPGFLPTNVVFWKGSLYVTELERGCVLRLEMDTNGLLSGARA